MSFPSMKPLSVFWLLLLTGTILSVGSSPAQSQERHRVPVIYSTDLFQPPVDPDDHYDLAILAALEELEVKALIFDLGTANRNADEIGMTALNQIAKITGCPVPPWKAGLRNPLRSPDDKALDQSEEFQGGVALILSTLEQSEEPVVMFLVGSCRDFAVAFNRNPDLLRNKVKAVYVNAGNGIAGNQTEWNVTLDPNAYLGLMNSGLPICWCPCFTDVYQLPTPEDVSADKAFCTYFVVPNQAELLAPARKELKNYVAYALDQSHEEPLAFLEQDAKPLPESPRNMWCTGPFLHAAGRSIEQIGDRQWVARPSKNAGTSDQKDHAVEVFRFEPVRLKSVTKTEDEKLVPEFSDDPKGESSVLVFRYVHPDFNDIMRSVLGNLLETL